MWTTQERCPHGPQAHQQQQKRSIDVLPKPDNLTCCLHCGGITQPPSTVSSKTIEFYKRFFGFSISEAAGSVAGVVLISRPRGGHAITVLQTLGHDPVYRRVRASMISC